MHTGASLLLFVVFLSKFRKYAEGRKAKESVNKIGMWLSSRNFFILANAFVVFCKIILHYILLICKTVIVFLCLLSFS